VQREGFPSAIKDALRYLPRIALRVAFTLVLDKKMTPSAPAASFENQN
jgi:hypothetical protein